jgi:RNA polymerase sigma-70 factor (ECF subfamily)
VEPVSPARERLFRSMFEREASYVMCSLRRLGVHERDVPDVAHDVFVTVYRLLDDAFDADRPVRPWLFAVALRVAADHRRLARHREIPTDALHERRDEATPADEAIVADQRRALVLRALDTLDLDQRAVVVMHDLDEVAVPAIAVALSIPLNTAYSRLRLGRERFRAAVTRLARGER